ncbi:murein biosynthesis integral membrane protein MurJ [Smaragdicoccus niigatensis]|uniref:murein biosynthesis integral membrane protein MurJ n=1 Tax=Smaragdicoccus niigatensis TaxID=359359 RepID=UPI00039DB246
MTSKAESGTGADSRLLATTGSIAIATLTSRITGFMKQVLIAAVLGGAIGSSFTVASVIPNMISEFVLGAVLTQVVIPVLVRSEAEDPDGGAMFIRRLFNAALVTLGTAAVLATAAAPLLTYLYLGPHPKVDPHLTTTLSYLLLPAILFYGLTALFTGILNTRLNFKPGAWAPVLNNVVFLAVLISYWFLPESLGTTRLYILGVGATFGVLSQVILLFTAIRKAGVDLRPKWGLDDRLRKFGGMAAAVLLYVAISQVGFIVATNVSAGHDVAGPIIYSNAWLLLQLPYGVIGVTLLTAIMPRMSRKAAANDSQGVIEDLTMGTRLTFLGLLPIVVFLTLMGRQVGVALYGYGKFTGDAARLGEAVSWSAFTLIPYALVLLYLRVFYAQERAWTPVWIVVGITTVKIVLSVLTPQVASDDNHVVILLGVANGLAYVTGAIISVALLRRSLGHLQLQAVVRTFAQIMVASLVAGLVMFGFDWVAHLGHLPQAYGGIGALVRVAIDGILYLGVTGVGLLLLRVPEVTMIWRSVTQRLRPAKSGQ